MIPTDCVSSIYEMRGDLFYKVGVLLIWNPDKDNTDHFTHSSRSFHDFHHYFIHSGPFLPYLKWRALLPEPILFTSKPKHDLCIDVHCWLCPLPTCELRKSTGYLILQSCHPALHSRPSKTAGFGWLSFMRCWSQTQGPGHLDKNSS